MSSYKTTQLISELTQLKLDCKCLVAWWADLLSNRCLQLPPSALRGH